MDTNGIGITVTLTREQWQQCAAAAERAGQPKIAARLQAELDATTADPVTVEVQDAGLDWLARQMDGTEAGQLLLAIQKTLQLPW